MSVQEDASKILRTLFEQPREEGGFADFSGSDLTEETNLSPDEINDAVTILVESDQAEWLQTLGTGPYDFNSVWITPRGRYEFEREIEQANNEEPKRRGIGRKPPSPIGSPYGFTDHDWEFVADRKNNKEILFVTLGYQFESDYYNSDQLVEKVNTMFQEAIDEYNQLAGSIPISLHYQPLYAGYGEHLFNQIARDIISSDISVFETSDLNPNVMLELGVALTWGVRVLPIKRSDKPKPPSDISGQTWADYTDSAGNFTDPDHMNKLVTMIQRAARKKGYS